jgi:hypothetical protein
MSHIYTPGPGDLMPKFAGHPHDSRTDDDDGSDDATAEVINDVRYWLNLAHVAALNADLAKARKHLEEAKTALDELLEPAP